MGSRWRIHGAGAVDFSVQYFVNCASEPFPGRGNTGCGAVSVFFFVSKNACRGGAVLTAAAAFVGAGAGLSPWLPC